MSGESNSFAEAKEKLGWARDHIGKRLDSRILFAGSRQVEIVHKDKIYRLQITRQGKLILTK